MLKSRKSRLTATIWFALASGGVALGLYALWPRDPNVPSRSWPPLEAAAPASSQLSIHVGENTQVSASFPDEDFEFCDVAGDPSNASRLCTSVCRWRGDQIDIVVFYSLDGGMSWDTGCERLAAADQRLSDMSVAYGRNGEIYLAHARFYPHEVRPLGTPSRDSVEFLTSPDHGKSWSERAALALNVDRPWLAIDNTKGAFDGRLYCLGNLDEPALIVSDDAARSLSEQLCPHPGDKFLNCRQANPVVCADGTMAIVYQDNGHASGKRPQLYSMTSTDGGKSFVARAPVNTRWWHDWIRSSNGETMWPRLAVDASDGPFSNRIYCVWADGTTDGFNGERVFFAYSTDRCATWSSPVVISEQPMSADQGRHDYLASHPSIAVNPRGVLAISWYDRRNLPPVEKVATSNPDVSLRKMDGWNVRIRSSVDGGATWLPSVQVNESPGRGEMRVGHTAGLTAAADGRFHAVWIDNRTGKHQLWTAAITVTDDLPQP